MAGDSMFDGFLKKARAETTPDAAGSRPGGFRHLQVRLVSGDAKRVKALADRRDLSVQDVLVEAINLLLADWQEPPVENPGTARKKA